jgi:hypothetical protein
MTTSSSTLSIRVPTQDVLRHNASDVAPEQDDAR